MGVLHATGHPSLTMGSLGIRYRRRALRPKSYSALMLASWIIFPYFAILLSMNVANLSGVEPMASKPSVASRALTSGCASALATPPCSLAAISAGRFFGPHRPYHDT